MVWLRNKSPTTTLSAPPSLFLLLFTGTLAVIASVVLFVLHSSGAVKILSAMNVWTVSLVPPAVWFLSLCIWGWFRGQEIDEHQFLEKEARYAQGQWEEWAERHLAILGSCVLLPDDVTADTLWKCNEGSFLSQNMCVCRLPPVSIADAVLSCLDGVQESLHVLPHDLPLRVTLLSDLTPEVIFDAFTAAWATLFPERAVPADVTTTNEHSFTWVEERLEQPALTVDLFIVVQLHGGDSYSDGMAALLLTSDDVAHKYQLPYPARLLRPMPLDLNAFEKDITLFLETQTVACRTVRILEDALCWNAISASLVFIGGKHGAAWQSTDTMMLEKIGGIPGASSPWILTAIAADLVVLRNVSLLALFSSENERFVSTITSGSEDANIG